MEADLEIIFDGETAIAYFTRLVATLPEAITSSLETASLLVAGVMREKAPVGATGALQESIGFTVTDFESQIMPGVNYANFVEFGTQPHWAPIAPLIPWADMHGLNPYAVRGSIHFKGTKPHPFVKPTFDDTATLVAPYFITGIETMLEASQA